MEVLMTPEEVLRQLEKHEESCDKRYAEIQRQLDKLDMRLWGIAALIVATALANRFLLWLSVGGKCVSRLASRPTKRSGVLNANDQ